jgi:hypothetical protein
MSWLADRPMWLLVVGFVGGLALVALTGRAAGRRLLRGSEASASSVAAPLMPALGTAFAVLAAFAVANAATGLRNAETDVSREANSVARLAWASTATADRGSAIQAALLAYVEATLAGEWRGIDRIPPGEGPAFDELNALQQVVRVEASAGQLATPQTGELLASIDDLSSARRSRFAEATPVEVGVVVLLVLSAMALVLNATILTLERGRRAAAVLTSLVVVTGLSIASVLTLGAPFSGSFGASQRPLADVADDLAADRFRLDP